MITNDVKQEYNPPLEDLFNVESTSRVHGTWVLVLKAQTCLRLDYCLEYMIVALSKTTFVHVIPWSHGVAMKDLPTQSWIIGNIFVPMVTMLCASEASCYKIYSYVPLT